MVRDVSKYLREQEEASTDAQIARKWSELDDLYTKRLWHQLTIKLLDFVKHPVLESGTKLIDLYENLIQDFEMRMNPLSLMEIMTLVTKQYQNPEEALSFLDKTEPKVKASKEAVALCKITKGQIKLLQLNDNPGTKVILEETDDILRQIDGVTSVHGRFYLLQSRLNQRTGDTAEYYRSALKFLGCTELSTLNLNDQRDHAKNLSIAALSAPDIYNFGELLAHPVLKSLKRTPDDWLVQLLEAFNAGRLEEFEKIKVKWSKEPTLKLHEKILTDKIRLLCLMEMTFRKPATERTLTFEAISAETKLKESEVELYVMKAIAKGLLKGRIDEVDRKVRMTWVQPRVLDRKQIGTMVSRLDGWKTEITKLETMVEKNAADILLL